MKLLVTSILLFLVQLTIGQGLVRIKGSLKNLDNHAINIHYTESGKNKKIQVASSNGTFEASVPIDYAQEINIYPAKYFANAIQLKQSKRYLVAPPIFLFVAPGDEIILTGDAMKMWAADVRGGMFNKELAAFNKKIIPISGEIFAAAAQRQIAKNDDNKAEVSKKSEELSKLAGQKNAILKDYIVNHTDLFSLYLFSQRMGGLQPKEISDLFERYPEDLKSTVYGQKIRDFMTAEAKSSIQSPMIDFKGKTLAGKDFDSKELRGKYVLLDFWGSWCQPCRKSHPHLLALYNQYKPKGFEIVGIAKERGADPISSWEKAVKEDNIQWIHLLHNQLQEQRDLIKEYSITAFPTKILIDPNGTIIWKGVGDQGDDLDKQLAKIF
ncbi:TlpA disulfide reductase family protein [Sphingobacterium ginsenosidimutans]|uniref:TlpA disulfide reductase family protein n=1 Tax=Sphingobacterium ginsenosidimutans TaxID=687845 RepID=A0ABP8A624_9SPHI